MDELERKTDKVVQEHNEMREGGSQLVRGVNVKGSESVEEAEPAPKRDMRKLLKQYCRMVHNVDI